MLRIIPIIFGAVLITFNSFGKANSVYHEFSMNTVATGCGTYASTMYPTNSDAITIQFTIDFQGNTNEARVYYTTDGSTPNAAYGVPFGTTQALTASYVSTYNNGSGIVDVVSATIPSLPSGAVINYIVSAWHTSGGDEIFANGGTNTSSATATGFSYIVGSTLPIRMISFTGKKEKEGIVLSWATAQETNADRYETYSAAFCVPRYLKSTPLAEEYVSYRSAFVSCAVAHESTIPSFSFLPVKLSNRIGNVDATV